MSEPKKISKSKRLKEIMSVFMKYKVVQNLSQQKNASEVKAAFEELGPTFIKIGQMLSVRTDLLNADFIQSFKTLQDNVKSDPFPVVKTLLEAEWQLPITDIFKSFDEAAFASASIGQAHHAVLKSGQPVVVKVQHPGIIEDIDVDLSLFEKSLPLIKHIPESNVVDLKNVLNEVRRSLDNETNFLKESQNAQEFYQYNNNWHQVKVPLIYPEYCTEKVIVMEQMPGRSLRYLLEADNDQLAYNEVTYGTMKKELALLLVDNFMKQVFADGYFHADPHPGNLFIHYLSNEENFQERQAKVKSTQQGNVEVVVGSLTAERLPPYRLIFLDFGMMGHLSESLQDRLVDALLALYTQDTRAMTEAIMQLTKQEGPFDENKFSDELGQFLQQYGNTPVKDIEIQEVLMRMIEICHDNNLQMDQEVTLLVKAFSTIEGVIEELDPELSLMEAIEPFAQKYFLKKINLKEEAKQQGLTFIKNVRMLPKFPEKIMGALDTVSSGKARLNLEWREQEQLLNRIERMVNRIVVALILAAVILSSSMLVVASPDRDVRFVDNLGVFGYSAALITIILLGLGGIYRWWKNRKKKG